MDLATESRRTSTLSLVLAGLQAGMLGVCFMLAWLGVSSTWKLRSFWTAENLMASVFYGERAIRIGFGWKTFSGMALYLLIYSSLGAIFALGVRDRIPPRRVMLLSLVFAVSWYYLSFGFIWRSMMPLVALLHASRPMLLGHLVYGTFLGRYPVYLPKTQEAAVEAVAEVEAETEAAEAGDRRQETE